MVKKVLTKVLFSMAIIFTSISVFQSEVNAHDLPEQGSELDGWKYVGSHWGTYNTYYFDATSSDLWLTHFRNGEAKFEQESQNKFHLYKTTRSETDNYVTDSSHPDAGWVARRIFYGISNDHPTRWVIQFNNDKLYTANSWSTIAAHEIGHVFGLADLYYSANSNKLMYGYDNGVRDIHSKEIEGLDYIYNRY
ncbi:hypothetical protein ACTWP4_18585 [Gracilibacillus sp. D59]|uniref:hypothetical protein n=1 Tax=Gracilibacillus sp. D59 TaxID=3457434 RepID=UPI003FCCF00D